MREKTKNTKQVIINALNVTYSVKPASHVEDMPKNIGWFLSNAIERKSMFVIAKNEFEQGDGGPEFGVDFCVFEYLSNFYAMRIEGDEIVKICQFEIGKITKELNVSNIY